MPFRQTIKNTKHKEGDVEDFELIERKQDPPFVKVQDKREKQRKSSEFVSSLLRLPYNHDKSDTILTTPPVLKAPPVPSDINKNHECKSDLQSPASNKMARFTKLSQKERKRLSSEQSQPSVMYTNGEQNLEVDKPKWLGWASKSPGSMDQQVDCTGMDPTEREQKTSLERIMQSQKSMEPLPEKIVKPTDISKTKQSTKKPKSWRTLDLNDTPTVMKPAPIPFTNPWNTTNAQNFSKANLSTDNKCAIWLPTSSTKNVGKQNDGSKFQDIMYQEALQSENVYRAQSKSLAVTQLEERAIEELKVFYNVENIFDELISVDRANASALATPVWNPRRKM